MKTLDHEVSPTALSGTVREAVEKACGRIAPTWPLDQFIAVNPYWGFVGSPVQSAASRIENYSGSRMLMPRSFYRECWNSGSLRAEHLWAALKRSGSVVTMAEALDALQRDAFPAPRVPLATSIVDSGRDLLHGMSMTAFVIHNLSQHCASYFDRSQSAWELQHDKSLYESWVEHACTDRSPKLLMGIRGMRKFARTVPQDPFLLIERAMETLPVPHTEWSDYFTALLMSINGWSSWCSYEAWQAKLSGRQDDHTVQLLAIRLGWELFAFQHLLSGEEVASWTTAWDTLLDWRTGAAHHLSVDWLLQEALEISYQKEVCESLTKSSSAAAPLRRETPAVQAVFCIDVRSEVFRRALESCSNEVQTLGFAGFFGLPISYAPLGTGTERPQLPGLLAPKLRVSDTYGSKDLDKRLEKKRQQKLGYFSSWKSFRSSSISTFTFVESFGLFYAASLVKRTLRSPGRTAAPDKTHTANGATLRPHLLEDGGSDGPSVEALCDMVAGILTNMSLTDGFARLLLLTGHGSHSTNNPHAAGLDCGACGGQSGEVNARVLAGLLNEQRIRSGLLTRGITVPETTYALGALHNTTTDEVTVFDTDLVPPSHHQDLIRLQHWLQQAGHETRFQRAESVGIRRSEWRSNDDLLHLFQERSRDWSQVRPEWGLANNAAFLIAPRERSRGVNLQGRAFLHEYRSELDLEGRVLEAIMTAPMLVTNWINMQYYASTVDNLLYGSGNKVLHNVVGGRLGVFEGNGGDLRIGLPLQSLHDGHTLRHTPLRLSVFIEARQSAIDAVIERHEVVRNLVRNGWIHLFHISPGTGEISRHSNGAWVRAEHNYLPRNEAEIAEAVCTANC